MRRRLLITYLALTTFVLASLALPLGITFAQDERRTLVADLQRDAFVLATRIEDHLELGTRQGLRAPLVDYTERTGARVVVTDADGIAIADTDPAVNASNRDFSSRPEIAAALRGDLASGVRDSETLGSRLLYVAVPVASSGRILGAIRLSFSTTALDARVRRSWITLGIVSLIALAMAAVLAFAFARWTTKPVRALADTASRLALGSLDARADPHAGPPEVRALAERFNDMAFRLQGLIDAQKTFVADASHQLRTPLTALRLRLENLEPALAAQDHGELDGAIAEADRLTRIVEGMLTLARAEGTRPERVAIDAAAVARERADAWEAFAAERGVTIAVEAGVGCTVLDVPGHLAQILDNLLANSLEAAPAGSAVTIRCTPTTEGCEVHVIDHGPGMSEQERTGAFDRFRRSGRSGGSGLGLAIVNQLAATSGGAVRLDEADGGGLDAVVTLASR